jgi:hypothetical protein
VPAKKTVTYPALVIAGAVKSKFHGRRGSPYNDQKLFAPTPKPGAWDVEKIQADARRQNWDHKGYKSDGALSFIQIVKEGGVLLALEAALGLVPRDGYDGYFTRRDVMMGLLRGALATCSEADWEAANERAEAAWKEDNARVHRTLAALFPHREDWGRAAHKEMMAEYKAMEKAKGYSPATYEVLDSVLLAGAGLSPERLIELINLGFFEFTPSSEPWLIDMAERLGADAGPVLAAFHRKHSPWFDYHKVSTRLLGTVLSAETFGACAERLGDWKKLEKSDVTLLRSAPELAIPALEAEVARYTKSRKRPKAWGTQRDAGAERAGAVLKELLAERRAEDAPAFDRSVLPAGLDASPWAGAAAAPAATAPSFKDLKPLPYPPKVVIPENKRAEFESSLNHYRLRREGQKPDREETLAAAHEAAKSLELYPLYRALEMLEPADRLEVYRASPDNTWKKTRYWTHLGLFLLAELGEEAADVAVRILEVCIKHCFLADAPFITDPRLAPRLAVFASQKKNRYKVLPLLERDPEAAAIGLVHAAVAGKGKPRSASIDYLKEMIEQGHEALVDDVLRRYGPAVTAAANEALGREGAPSSPAAPLAMPKMPVFWSPATLPPLKIKGVKAPLPLEVLQDIGGLLKAADPADPPPMLRALKQHTEPAALRAFCEALLKQWVGAGGPPAEVWAATWMGVLGGDEALEHLEPQLEDWCRQNRHQRAFAALDAFVVHPTDASALLLDQIARKSSFDGLKSRARGALYRLAGVRGLPPEDLLDVIAPDCGLSDCPMTLDFGHRSFTAGFDAALNPWVKGEDGKPRKDVPQPGKQDGPKARAHRHRWMQTRAAVRARARDQLRRLEDALVSQRRWTPERWRAFAAHPMLGLLARGLVWGCFDDDGALAATFRVDESGVPVTLEDEPAALSGAVGLPHPVQLSEEARRAWGAVFADYELVQPFPQLSRADLGPGDAPAIFEALKGATVPIGALLRLRRGGWSRGGDEDQGFYDGLDGRALAVRFDPSIDVVMSANSDEPRTITDVLGDLSGDPVVLSEELAALQRMLD